MSEKDEELQINSEQINLFNLYESSDKFVDEETELECVWPEKNTAKEILVSCEKFQLNLCLPYISNSSKISLGTAKKSTSIMNVREFFKTYL